MKPCDAGIKFSSPPLNKNIMLWRKIFAVFDITRNISNITAQLAPSSLAPE